VRVCIVRHAYDDCPRAFRNARQLAERGHDVEYVCLRRPGEPARSTIDGVRVRRIPLSHKRGGALRYAFEYGWSLLAALLFVTGAHLRKRFDVVQVHTLPDILVFCAIPAKLLGAHVALDLQECMPEFFAVRHRVGLGHPMVRLLAWIEQRAIQFADLPMTCTTQMLDTFTRRGSKPDRFLVIPNSADEKKFPSTAPARRPSTPFRLVTHGSLVPAYDLETVVHAIARVPKEVGELRLDIFGDGEDKGKLIQLSQALGLTDRIRFRGRVPHSELIDNLVQADAGIVAVQRNPFRDLTHCMKMFEYIQLGVPVLAADTPAVRAYFDGSCFEFFSASDPNDLAAAIVRSASDPERRLQLAVTARERNEVHRWLYQGPRYARHIEALGSATDGRVASVEERAS
jgi:glycosyltransferase involved in cell wall biosynthesis